MPSQSRFTGSSRPLAEAANVGIGRALSGVCDTSYSSPVLSEIASTAPSRARSPVTPHQITIEHPARTEDGSPPAKELAAAHSPSGDLTLCLPPALDGIGLIGGALGLAAQRGGLITRVQFLSPRAVSDDELGGLREFVQTQLLEGVGEGGIKVGETLVRVGLVDERPGKASQKAMKISPKARPVLAKAAERGDLGAVQKALLLGESPDTRDKHGQTALSVACREQQEAIVRALLKGGADVDGQWETASNTPLGQASTVGSLAIVELLISAGAGPDVRAAERDPLAAGLTPLGWACNRGHEAVVERLLAAGADPNIQDDEGQTALHLLGPKYTALLDRLLEAGANPSLANQQGRDAAQEALLQATAFEDPQFGDPEMVAAHREKAARLLKATGQWSR